MRRRRRGFGSRLDRAIGAVFPRWAAARVRARLRAELHRQRLRALSTYDAAERSRNTADWEAKNNAADSIILADYPTLLARSRAAVRDDWAAASLIDGHVRHIIGTGITMRANARDALGRPHALFNRQINRLWRRWARSPRWVDVERRKNFLMVQSLVVRELMTAGQAFVMLNYEQRPDMVGLQLQMFEAEQLDTTKSRNPDTGNDIKRGVEVDSYGAAVAYWVYVDRHPMDSYTRSRTGDAERIPAERILHLLRQDRVRQTYGVPRLAAVLRNLWHRKMYEEYTLLRARFEACGGVSIESDPESEFDTAVKGTLGSLTDPSGVDTDDLNNKQFQIEPNMIWELPPGKRVAFHDPKTPGGQYVPYVERQVLQAAAGAGLDYPTVARDFRGGSFTAQRQGQLEVWLETDPIQDYLIDVLCRPIGEAFITYAVMEGRADAPGFFLFDEVRAEYLEADWQPQPKPWIDPANQAAAAKIELEQRLTSRARILNERGTSEEEIFDEMRDGRRLAAERGITLPEFEAEHRTDPHEPRPRAETAEGTLIPDVEVES